MLLASYLFLRCLFSFQFLLLLSPEAFIQILSSFFLLFLSLTHALFLIASQRAESPRYFKSKTGCVTGFQYRHYVLSDT